MIWYNYINAGLLIIIWIVILSGFSNNKQKRAYWLLFFFIYSITEFISIVFEIYSKNNLWLYNISKPLQFLSLIAYFFSLLSISLVTRLITLVCSVAIFTSFLLLKRITDYNSLVDIIFSSFILVLCLIYFYRLISNDEELHSNSSEIWFCASIFLFFGPNLCINGALNFLLKIQFSVARKLFYLLVINSYIFYLFTLYALFITSGSKKRYGR